MIGQKGDSYWNRRRARMHIVTIKNDMHAPPTAGWAGELFIYAVRQLQLVLNVSKHAKS